MKIALAVDGSTHSIDAMKWGLEHLVHANDFVYLVCVGKMEQEWTDIVDATFCTLNAFHVEF